MTERIEFYGQCVNCSGPEAIQVYDPLLDTAWQFELQHVACLPVLEGADR